MKLISSQLVRSWRRSRFLSSGIYDGVLCHYSTSSSTSWPSTSTAENNRVSSLYKRVSIAGDPRVSMAPILDQWIQEGHEIDRKDLHFLVNRLWTFRRFAHALQVSEWMKEKHSSLSLKGTATQLELISRVYGLHAAENYFNHLPHTSRTRVVFYALLNCYMSAKSVRKAEDLMQKMKKLGFANAVLPYNIMLKLYIQLEKYDTVKQVMEEMDKMGFNWDTFTYRILLNAYSNSGKVSEMETVLMKMEADPQHIMKHTDYISTANGYLKAGAVDKSLIMLKRAEHLANGKVKKHVCHCLLTLYARAKGKEEVFRIWNVYKRSWDIYNKGYLSMVSALVILDDLEGAEKIIDEWMDALSGDGELDFKVVNSLLRAYGKRGDLERAEALICRLRERSAQEPPRSTWATLAIGYQMHNQMEDSVKTMKKAFLTDHGANWVLSRVSLVRCLDYLKMKGNLEELEEFKALIEKLGYNAENLLSGMSEDGEEKCNIDHQAEEDDVESDDVIVWKAD